LATSQRDGLISLRGSRAQAPNAQKADYAH